MRIAIRKRSSGLEIYSNGLPEPEHSVTKEEGAFIQKIAWEQYQDDRKLDKQASSAASKPAAAKSK